MNLRRKTEAPHPKTINKKNDLGRLARQDGLDLFQLRMGVQPIRSADWRHS
jgi:hypothetical protein